MQIQYISDLHLECSDFVVEKSGDILVLAGDIFTRSSADRFERFMERTMDLGFTAVLFVLGNHEGYGWTIQDAKDLLQRMQEKYSKFYFLDRSGVPIDGQRFIGASLWSNPSQVASIHARLYIQDYRAIRGWTVNKHVEEHFKDLDFLTKVCREGDVVITHFPPTKDGTDFKKFPNSSLASWFVNDLNDMIIKVKPRLWISGHTHHIWDAMIGDTQVVGNCRGYTWNHHSTGNLVGEVKEFNPIRATTIEVTDYRTTGVAS